MKINVKKGLMFLPFAITSLWIVNHFLGDKAPTEIYELPRTNITVIVDDNSTFFIAEKVGQKRLFCKTLRSKEAMSLLPETPFVYEGKHYKVSGGVDKVIHDNVFSKSCDIEEVR